MVAAQIFDKTHIHGENLACTRGLRPIFKNICFDIKNGDILQIKGPNGIGKSTFLRAIAGLLPFTTSHITHNGKAVPNLEHMETSFLNHFGGLHPDLSPHQHALFWAKLYSAPSKKILPPSLQHCKDAPVRTLSAGQRQQILLHQLNHTAPLWLLDEPFLSLDTDHVVHYAQAINTHSKKGGMTLLVSHQDFDLGDMSIKIHHMDGHAIS